MQQPIALVALDLDGTLLDAREGISPGNTRAIRAALDRGVRVAIVTGRALTDLPATALRSLGIDLPVVCAHGALTVDLQTNAALRHVPVPAPHALELLEHAERHQFSAAAYVDDRFWCFEGDPATLRFVRGPQWHSVPSLARTLARHEPTFLRFFGRESVDAVRDAFSERPLHFKHEQWDTWHECAVTSSDATKEIALAALCAHAGVPATRVLAIGDSRNDVPMLRLAGVGVAMGNALPEVRRRVGRVTDTCDRDGVARAIERYVLRPEAEACA